LCLPAALSAIAASRISAWVSELLCSQRCISHRPAVGPCFASHPRLPERRLDSGAAELRQQRPRPGAGTESIYNTRVVLRRYYRTAGRTWIQPPALWNMRMLPGKYTQARGHTGALRPHAPPRLSVPATVIRIDHREWLAVRLFRIANCPGLAERERGRPMPRIARPLFRTSRQDEVVPCWQSTHSCRCGTNPG
jgi:hypothetical protein